MQNRYGCVWGVVRYFHRESGRKKELEAAGPISMDAINSQQDLSVRIIHAGGRVERYQCAIHAGRLMEKYPNMCIARPDVFKQPHKSVIRWDEYLLPGQKFYLIPQSTVKKLKHKHLEELKLQVGDEPKWKGYNENKPDAEEDREDNSDDSVFSAKDFYVSGKRWSSRVLRLGMAEKPFTPPIQKVKMWQGAGWEPSLDSVEELSP